MTEKSQLPLPRRKKQNGGDVFAPPTSPPPPPPPPRDRSFHDIAGRIRKIPPRLPFPPEFSDDAFRAKGSREWNDIDWKCRDDLSIYGGDRDGSSDNVAAEPKRTSGLFISGRSASADCGELRISAAVTTSISGYQLKSSSGASDFCWPSEDNGPIYHELDPLIVARQTQILRQDDKIPFIHQQSNSSPPSPYHTYQTIADVHWEVEQLRHSLFQINQLPTTSSAHVLSTSATTPESAAATTSTSSVAKWAIFSRLRLPRRKTAGNDVTATARQSSTMARLSLSPGSGYRMEQTSVDKMTSSPNYVACTPMSPPDRKQHSSLSPLRRVDDRTVRQSDSRCHSSIFATRPLPPTEECSNACSASKTPVETGPSTQSGMRRATSGDVFFFASDQQPAGRRFADDESSSNGRRPHSDNRKPNVPSISSPSRSSIPTPASGAFSSPCCGVRMAEMRAATRRSSGSGITSPVHVGGGGSVTESAFTSGFADLVSIPSAFGGGGVNDDVFAAALETSLRQQWQTSRAATACKETTVDVVTGPLSPPIASLDPISEEDSSSSRHYVSFQMASSSTTMASTSTAAAATSERSREIVRDAVVNGVAVQPRLTSRSPDADARRAPYTHMDERTRGGHRSRPTASKPRTRHMSADHIVSNRQSQTTSSSVPLSRTMGRPPIGDGGKNVRATLDGPSSTTRSSLNDKRNERTSASPIEQLDGRPPPMNGGSQGSKLKARQQHHRKLPLSDVSDGRSASSGTISSSDRSASSTLDSEIVLECRRHDSVDGGGNRETNDSPALSASDSRTRIARRVVASGGGGSRPAASTATKKTSRLRSPRASSSEATTLAAAKADEVSVRTAATPTQTELVTAQVTTTPMKHPTTEVKKGYGYNESPRRRKPTEISSLDRRLNRLADSITTSTDDGSYASSTIDLSSSMTSSSGSSAAGCVSTTSGADIDSPDATDCGLEDPDAYNGSRLPEISHRPRTSPEHVVVTDSSGLDDGFTTSDCQARRRVEASRESSPVRAASESTARIPRRKGGRSGIVPPRTCTASVLNDQGRSNQNVVIDADAGHRSPSSLRRA